MSTYFQLEKQAQQLIESGRMPSLSELLAAVVEARENFLPLILAARNDGNRFCDSAERKEDYERT
jgi:hypothetical protein